MHYHHHHPRAGRRVANTARARAPDTDDNNGERARARGDAETAECARRAPRDNGTETTRKSNRVKER